VKNSSKPSLLII